MSTQANNTADPLDNMTDGVEVGGDFANEQVIADIVDKPARKPAARRQAEIEDNGPAAEEPEIAEGDEPEAEIPDEEGEKPAKKGKPAKDRIQDLNKRLRETERELEREKIKNELRQEMGLQPNRNPVNVADTRVPPDPRDLTKYPLGGLDDRYLEDLTDWKVDQKLGSVLQRQQEQDAQKETERVLSEVRAKADGLVQRGREKYDDFAETVWEAGLREDYKLTQITFEAVAEAEYGDEVIYALANNPAEAERVSKLSPFQQIKYVSDKSAEFAAKQKPKLPKAGTPPSHQSRGSSGKYDVAVDTEDLGAFKKALFK
jgi:hypothetical protein